MMSNMTVNDALSGSDYVTELTDDELADINGGNPIVIILVAAAVLLYSSPAY